MTWLFFLLVALVVVTSGRAVAYYGDVLAEKTGLGRSVIGLVLVAATTSLPELFSSTSSLLQDLPEIAVGNILGANMVNFLLLVFLDAFHPYPVTARASQKHALALGLVLLLLATVGLGLLREVGLGRVGLAASALVPLYGFALWLSFRYARRFPQEEALEREAYAHVPLRLAMVRYGAGALVLVAAAVVLPVLANRLAQETGLGGGWVGTFLVGLITTLPEASVVVAAARLGAVDLAMGNAVGSVLFNTFLLGVGDLVYPKPLLGVVAEGHAATVLILQGMVGVVLMGLMYRSLRKLWVLSYDNWGVLLLYLLAMAYGLALR
ncbi:sodium:calcium antiporter [Thermus sediminis]|uniref:sodium:calcium antiporter n=1 Tax=Thermus sediminis TaxID=1761908 RepID=UPI000E3C0875|nr:sodium:calcium antiporter [Thermus sediminis]